jgi:zinc transport system permease protein
VIELLAEPLAQGFMRRALLMGALLGAVGALLGVFIVQRGLALLSDGLAHATFGGLAIGLLAGASSDNAIWAALPFTVAVALAIAALRRRARVGSDAATGVFFAFSFALGVVLLGLRPPRAGTVSVEALLFGSILSVSPDILVTMLVVGVLALVTLVFAWSRLAYATFDPELALLSGVPVAALEYLLLGLTAVVVVVGVKTVGVVLVSAFIVIPAATARLLGRTLRGIAVLAAAFGVGGSAFGLLLSYHLNVASGATVILTLASFFFAALLASRRGGETG